MDVVENDSSRVTLREHLQITEPCVTAPCMNGKTNWLCFVIMTVHLSESGRLLLFCFDVLALVYGFAALVRRSGLRN